MSWPEGTEARVHALTRVVSYLDDRLELVEKDLDCDAPGGLAEAIKDLRGEVADLRAVVEEWVPRAIESERRAG